MVLLVVLVAATAFGLWRRRTDGRLRAVSARRDHAVDAGVDANANANANSKGEGDGRFAASDLGVELGDRATLLQFSSAFCQLCRATRRVLLEVSEMVDGVVAVEVDAEAHLDLVRRWGVMRTPTVFVLDATGRVTQRAAGQPRKVDVIAAIGALDGGRGAESPTSET